MNTKCNDMLRECQTDRQEMERTYLAGKNFAQDAARVIASCTAAFEHCPRRSGESFEAIAGANDARELLSGCDCRRKARAKVKMPMM